MRKEFIETGKIVSTHGVAGEVKVFPWCDTPAFLTGFSTVYLEGGRRALAVQRARLQNTMVLLKFAGVDTLEEAAALRNQVLYLARADIALQPGEYLVQDLLDLQVVDADTGEEYGRISAVSPTGANDVYHIACPAGPEKLIPAIRDVVIETDLEQGVMRIRPLAGLFDDAD